MSCSHGVALPSSVSIPTLRSVSIPIHDQSAASTCTAHAITACHELVTGLRFVTEDIYPSYLDDDDGAKGSECLRLLSTKGQRVIHSSTYHTMDMIVITRDLHVVKQKLAAGLPLVCGMLWDSVKGESGTLTISDNTGDNTIRRSSRRQKSNSKEELGKHCIVLCGYRDDHEAEGGGYFTFVNSHGEHWGNKGVGMMSYGYWLSAFIDGFVPHNKYAFTNIKT